jgi:6-phosphogluconolactonase
MKEGGVLEAIGTASTVPDEYSEKTHTSEIRVHPSGAFAFCTNRGHNTVATIAIDAAGVPSVGPRAETAHTPQVNKCDSALASRVPE